LARQEKFRLTNFTKISSFLLNQDEFRSNCRQAHQNIGGNS